MKIIGQTSDGNLLLVELDGSKGVMVDVATGKVFPESRLNFLLKRFPWIPFKGDFGDEILSILKDEGVGVS